MATLPTPPVAPVTAIGPERRALVVLLHAVQGERRREAGGADGHGRAQVEPGRQRVDEIRRARVRSRVKPPSVVSLRPQPTTTTVSPGLKRGSVEDSTVPEMSTPATSG